jgi:hypothetical protein
MSDRLEQRLNSEKSKNSVNTSTFIKVNMGQKQKLLPPNNINKIVNVAERFDVERQRCTFYRIISTITPIVSNPLFNLTDPNGTHGFTWAGFNTIDFLDRTYPYDYDVNDEEDLNYVTSISKHLKEKDGWFGFYDPDITKKSSCNYFDMEPKRERFSLLPDYFPFNNATTQTPVKNWEITITYPSSSDKNHNLVKNGLKIIDRVFVESNTKQMIAFGIPCLHNLSVGDTVRITGTNGYNGDHQVQRLGLDNGDFKGYYFVLDLPITGSINNMSRFKKVINNIESEYYFRLFKKIKTKNASVIETDDYETYQAGFSENAFNDPIVQVMFNEDIDVSNLTDNLGRPLSELYFTTIKTDSNNLFTNISSGIETPFISNLLNSDIETHLRDVPAINRIHNGTTPFVSHTPLENNVLINNSVFYGDLVEYNTNDLLEVTLAVASHRFNTKNRETVSNFSYVTGPPLTGGGQPQTKNIDLGPRHEGYFYSPHNLIKIRNFSNYIETGDEFTGDLPSYAVNLGDGQYKWRELINIGFNETDSVALNYPFLNGVHYMYNNYCTHIRRQDPFAYWGLYHSKFPSDPIGDRITDKFQVNSVDDVC